MLWVTHTLRRIDLAPGRHNEDSMPSHVPSNPGLIYYTQYFKV